MKVINIFMKKQCQLYQVIKKNKLLYKNQKNKKL